MSAALSIAANPDEFRRATQWLEALGQTHQIPEDKVYALSLCLNEALANVLSYSGIDAAQALIGLTFAADHQPGASAVTVTVSDPGIAFDPLRHVPKPLPATLEDATPGGGGIVLMRAFADALSYTRAAERNSLRFTVCWSP
ncbi:MAG: ATP-binding protein [Rhodoferax sp.]|nr:ATP-binding protein [Rhodoferax sp.]